MKKSTILAAIVVLIFLAGVLLIQQWASTLASVFPATVTDISRYEEILNSVPSSPLTQHFPRTIPANAKDVRIDYYPGFMMGGGDFQLRLTLPTNEIEKICAKYSKIAAHCLASGQTGDQQDAPPMPAFYTGNTKKPEFPDSFIVLVLLAESMGDEKYPWDHGQTCGLSVDRASCEVVYWAEWW